MMVCSSAKVDRSSFAMYVARVDDAAFEDGTVLGRYTMSRTGE